MTREQLDRVLYGTVDPTVILMDKPIPAMTTLLLRVCDNNPEKFDEVIRLIELILNYAENIIVE